MADITKQELQDMLSDEQLKLRRFTAMREFLEGEFNKKVLAKESTKTLELRMQSARSEIANCEGLIQRILKRLKGFENTTSDAPNEAHSKIHVVTV